MGVKQVLFGFEGRLPRLRWLGWSCAVFAATAVVWSLAFFLGYALESQGNGIAMLAAGLVAGVWGIVLVWTSLALNAKRLHDLGLSGWHLLWINGANVVAQFTAERVPVLAMLCGLAGLVVAAVFIFKKGTPGPNAYGGDPVGPGHYGRHETVPLVQG